MRFSGLVLLVVAGLTIVLTGTTTDFQPLVLPLPYEDHRASDGSRATAASPELVKSTSVRGIDSSSSASNKTILAETELNCFKQASSTARPFRPIVLEDCYKIFFDIFLVRNALARVLYTPGKKAYHRQNGNCVFDMQPILGQSLPSYFTEFQIGATLATIVDRCVRSETEYLGGQQELVAYSGWVVQVIGDGPP